MRFRRLLSGLIMTTFGLGVSMAAQTLAAQSSAPAKPGPVRMVLTSTSFADGMDIPVKYTAAGTSTSPALMWSNFPPNTVTFVLHMHDMEGSRNHTTEDQLHWLVWNIPGSVTSLPEGIPMGAQLQNGAYQVSASGAVYRGPGAPADSPRHHYVFELYALDTKVDVQPGADPFETRAAVLKAIQGHVIAKAVYMGLYHISK